MTLYGIGVGPGDPDLLTLKGKTVLQEAEVVYCPGRLSESVAAEYVSEECRSRLEFPMTDDQAVLEEAWAEAAAEVAPNAAENPVAFVTIGDPNVYSTFGHLRRTIRESYPSVSIEVIPGVSVVTSFASALDVEIHSGGTFGVREAAGRDTPTGPDQILLLKVTEVEELHEELVSAGYDVRYGRRLFMNDSATLITEDPDALDEGDYYTVAYAERVSERSDTEGLEVGRVDG